MKKDNKFFQKCSSLMAILLAILIFLGGSALNAQDQDSTEATEPAASSKPVKNTFGTVFLIDNQTVEVPVKGTFEFDIIHRFGTVENGYDDFWGFFAPSNIKLGLSYSPVKKLYVGMGMTKYNMLFDVSLKYALLQQTKDNRMPISVTYYGNMAIDTRDKSNFRYNAHRLSYFNQIMIARKISNEFSAQVSPSLSWFNNVEGYESSSGEIKGKMENFHFAVSVLGRYKVSEKMAIIANYDQPLTQHPANNPHPNISFGVEISTSSHAFQIFAGNYHYISPQYNNMYNQYDYTEGQFLIGFNINRLWNF